MVKFIKDYYEYMKIAFSEVFAKKEKIFSVLGLSLMFITLNLVLLEYLQIGRLLFDNLIGFFDGVRYALMTMPLSSKFVMIAISVLSATLVVFAFSGYQKNQELTGSAGSGGILLGLLAPACPSCGIGALSLLGFGSLGALLPFGGKEIGFIAIFVLLGSLLYVSREIAAPRCKI